MPRGRPWLDDLRELATILIETLRNGNMSEFTMSELVESCGTDIASAYEQRKGEALRAEIWDALHRAIRYAKDSAETQGQEPPILRIEGTYKYRFQGTAERPISTEIERLVQAVRDYNQLVQRQFLDRLARMKERLPQGPHNGDALVAFTGKLLSGLGFTPRNQPRLTHDGGIDLMASKDDDFGITSDYVVQLKHWKTGVVGKASLTDILNNLVNEPQKYGLVITTSTFNKRAQTMESPDGRLRLVNGEKLFHLCAEKQVGVLAQEIEVEPGRHLEIPQIDNQWFTELEEDLTELGEQPSPAP